MGFLWPKRSSKPENWTLHDGLRDSTRKRWTVPRARDLREVHSKSLQRRGRRWSRSSSLSRRPIPPPQVRLFAVACARSSRRRPFLSNNLTTELETWRNKNGNKNGKAASVAPSSGCANRELQGSR